MNRLDNDRHDHRHVNYGVFLCARPSSSAKRCLMTKPKLGTCWQESLPDALPRHLKRNITLGEHECWLWTRSLSPDGYGWASLNNKTYQAHRLVYRLIKGYPPTGDVLDHLCRVRHCVNPDHLEPVSPRENLRRSELTPTGMDHCMRCGGPFEFIGRTTTQRRCKVCAEERRREYIRECRNGIRRRSHAD